MTLYYKVFEILYLDHNVEGIRLLVTTNTIQTVTDYKVINVK